MPDFLADDPDILLSWIERGMKALEDSGEAHFSGTASNIAYTMQQYWKTSGAGESDPYGPYLDMMWYGGVRTEQEVESMFWEFARKAIPGFEDQKYNDVFEILSKAEDVDLDEWGIPRGKSS